MKLLSQILFPVAVTLTVSAAAFGTGSPFASGVPSPREVPLLTEVSDTVIYDPGAYKYWRRGQTPPEEIPDSLLAAFRDTLDLEDAADTLPRLRARDTIKAPDSLRLTDPFRYRFYVALVDSLTHVETRDSLKHSYDSLRASAKLLFGQGDSLLAAADTLHARIDSLDWRKLDSLYAADSTAAAIAKELAYYNSLDRRARRKYDYEKALPAKLAEMDSLRKLKEDKKARKDSITRETPRILSTYALPDSMQYKRIIAWTEDRDFGDLHPFVPDTSYRHHYYDDYPWRRKDVGSSNLGVDGSPVQYYSFFKRETGTDVPFYEAQLPWAFTPSTVLQYNSKTPHTELAYYGTLLSGEEKESDNLHILTTQNITPEFNFTLAYDRFGGEGMLINEATTNKNFTASVNWLGKKYQMNGGYIYNMVKRGENGGISDNYWVRDTSVNSRDIKVNLTKAESKIKKHTFYLDQQLRIPFNFIARLKAGKDTLFVADSVGSDITTAFIGHSSEYSTYSRKYTDRISDNAGKEFYNNVFLLDPVSSADSMHVSVLDNKVYLRLQPWSSEALVSRIDVGVGDCLRGYYTPSLTDTTTTSLNSFYLYAGARGQYKQYFSWNARGRFDLLGYSAGDFNLKASAQASFFPFRRAKKSPVKLAVDFETGLKTPSWYTGHVYANHYRWDNTFDKESVTKVQAKLDIPHWKMNAELGYALLSGNIYYDTLGLARQNTRPLSVLSASLQKNFVFGDLVHLDNRALLQFSSNEEVLPLPRLALNLRYYIEFPVQKYPDSQENVMTMQIGVDGLWNTRWYSPSWNPNLGVFYNQNKILYNNGPVFDAFVNIQWKRACIFVKLENAAMGWPLEKADYFTANHYTYTQRVIRFGLFWPFYKQATRNNSVGGR